MSLPIQHELALKQELYPEGSMIEVAVPYSPKAANIFVPAWIVYSKELSRGDIFRHGLSYRIRELTAD